MKTLRGATSKPENNSDCRVLAPFVMTLFDGEADEFEARRARAHLLVCQICANRWLDWNRSRDLLQSAPVMAPPPQLLWRVLMACRLASHPTPRRVRPAPERAGLGTPVPTHISTQILARTTRAAPQQASIQAPRRRFAMRNVPLFAAPALMAWMLILQRDVWLPVQLSLPKTLTSRVPGAMQKTHAPAPARRNRRPSGALVSVRSIQGPDSRQQAAPVVVMASPIPLTEVNRSALPAPREASAVRVSVPVDEAIRVIEASFGASSGAGTPREVQREIGEDGGFVPAREAVTFRPLEMRPSRRDPGVRLAAFSDQSRDSRLNDSRLSDSRWQGATLSARGSSPTTRATRLAAPAAPSTPQLLRVSLPSASAPQPARFVAEAFDSDDARVDEARSVVDEFRATLGSDAASETNSNDDNAR